MVVALSHLASILILESLSASVGRSATLFATFPFCDSPASRQLASARPSHAQRHRHRHTDRRGSDFQKIRTGFVPFGMRPVQEMKEICALRLILAYTSFKVRGCRVGRRCRWRAPGHGTAPRRARLRALHGTRAGHEPRVHVKRRRAKLILLSGLRLSVLLGSYDPAGAGLRDLPRAIAAPGPSFGPRAPPPAQRSTRVRREWGRGRGTSQSVLLLLPALFLNQRPLRCAPARALRRARCGITSRGCSLCP